MGATMLLMTFRPLPAVLLIVCAAGGCSFGEEAAKSAPERREVLLAEIQKDPSRWEKLLPEMASKGDPDLGFLLATSEARPSVHDVNEALRQASARGCTAALTSLLAHGNPDLEAESQNGLRPLHLAARWGQSDCVAILAREGADLEARTTSGISLDYFHRRPSQGESRELTPLMAAAMAGRAETAAVLLTLGADPKAKTERGETALSIAKKRKEDRVVQVLTLFSGLKKPEKDTPKAKIGPLQTGGSPAATGRRAFTTQALMIRPRRD